jgi:beta-xylosidase
MNTAGDSIVGKPVMVYDGHLTDPTIEGPKLHQRNGYYYIFAPAGGVSTGWQLVLRSKNIYGPYERKVVMDQGKSAINGPHQGAWVYTKEGKDWFIHFQDKDAYGRVVHLQPMFWKNDWPVIGIDTDGDGTGTPVTTFTKPVANAVRAVPATSDEFNQTDLGLQWQWQANDQEGWAFGTNNGFLRVLCHQRPDTSSNWWNLPNILLQKFPAETFSARTKITTALTKSNDQVGLMVFGINNAYLSVIKKQDGEYIQLQIGIAADKGTAASTVFLQKINSKEIYLELSVNKGAICTFSFSEDGHSFQKISTSFTAKPGKWVGAKLGILATGTTATNDVGTANIDYFRLYPL